MHVLQIFFWTSLSGSLCEVSLLSCFLNDGSNSNIKADNVNIHWVELPSGMGSVSSCYHSLMKVLLLTTSSNLNMCEAHDTRDQIYLSEVCIKRVSRWLQGNLITVFNFNENKLKNSNVFWACKDTYTCQSWFLSHFQAFLNESSPFVVTAWRAALCRLIWF